jgi:hypothetical protein
MVHMCHQVHNGARSLMHDAGPTALTIDQRSEQRAQAYPGTGSLYWDPCTGIRSLSCTQSYPAQLHVDRIRYARGNRPAQVGLMAAQTSAHQDPSRTIRSGPGVAEGLREPGHQRLHRRSGDLGSWSAYLEPRGLTIFNFEGYRRGESSRVSADGARRPERASLDLAAARNRLSGAVQAGQPGPVFARRVGATTRGI